MSPAFRTAARSECAAAAKIAGQVNAATIIADLLQGAPRWQAELSAADTIHSPGIPDGHNLDRTVAVKLAEAALAISVANQSATSVPMKVSEVRRTMGQATSALDDATGECANAGY